MSATGQGAEEVEVESSAGGAGSGGDPELHSVLRILAETQQEFIKLHKDSGPRRMRLLLSQVKLPEFDGHVKTSTKKYREWRKTLIFGI